MLIAFAAVLAVLACAALAIAGTIFLGFEPPWLAGARHGLGEARRRAGEVLAEFGDWLRLGR